MNKEMTHLEIVEAIGQKIFDAFCLDVQRITSIYTRRWEGSALNRDLFLANYKESLYASLQRYQEFLNISGANHEKRQSTKEMMRSVVSEAINNQESIFND